MNDVDRVNVEDIVDIDVVEDVVRVDVNVRLDVVVNEVLEVVMVEVDTPCKQACDMYLEKTRATHTTEELFASSIDSARAVSVLKCSKRSVSKIPEDIILTRVLPASSHSSGRSSRI